MFTTHSKRFHKLNFYQICTI